MKTSDPGATLAPVNGKSAPAAQSPIAAHLIVALLRTLNDVQQAWDPRSGGDGVRLMPRAYHEGSYQELERCLRIMRTEQRVQWWHVSHRYRWGTERWATLPYRRTPKGPIPQLPHHHCELVNIGQTNTIRTIQAKLYEWHPLVDPAHVTAGITWLQRTMHAGDTSRLRVPNELLWHMLGITKPAA